MLGEILDACQYFSKRVSYAGTGDERVLRKCQAVMPPPLPTRSTFIFWLDALRDKQPTAFRGLAKQFASPRTNCVNRDLTAEAPVWDAAVVSA
jgi:hypothetical protein